MFGNDTSVVFDHPILPLFLQLFLLAFLLSLLNFFLRGFLVLHSCIQHLLGILATHLVLLRLRLLLLVFFILLFLLFLLLFLFLVLTLVVFLLILIVLTALILLELEETQGIVVSRLIVSGVVSQGIPITGNCLVELLGSLQDHTHIVINLGPVPGRGSGAKGAASPDHRRFGRSDRTGHGNRFRPGI